ncbi:hypothetical protein HanRHA438_Chr04g0167471 [Helianthus annuus]|nr:hypothetical protein HanRHA438_Chr04g0167471 [Helianthus annuus]
MFVMGYGLLFISMPMLWFFWLDFPIANCLCYTTVFSCGLLWSSLCHTAGYFGYDLPTNGCKQKVSNGPSVQIGMICRQTAMNKRPNRWE